MSRALLIAVALFALPEHAVAKPAGKVDHVCAAAEGKETCPLGRVRMCAKDGSLAACACAPGSTEKTTEKSSTCVVDTAPTTVACVVPDVTIGKAMAPYLDFGALEMPPLPTSQLSTAADIVVGREDTASADELADAAKTWDGLEGAAAFEANAKKGKAKLAMRDYSNAHAITVRDKFLARFVAHPRLDEVRVGLARALLRRAAYVGVGPSVDVDRARANGLLADVAAGSSGRFVRDARFMLGERAVRDKDWPKVLVHEEQVLKLAAPKTQADDHPFIAAATARLAQARLETGDLARGRASLEDAIALGLTCAPRTECVVAASAARRVLAAAYASSSQPAHLMIGVLSKGTLPRPDRVRPLLQLDALYTAGVGAGCKAAAEEARAWEQTFP